MKRNNETGKVPEVEGKVASTFEEAAKQLPMIEVEMKTEIQETRKLEMK